MGLWLKAVTVRCSQYGLASWELKPSIFPPMLGVLQFVILCPIQGEWCNDIATTRVGERPVVIPSLDLEKKFDVVEWTHSNSNLTGPWELSENHPRNGGENERKESSAKGTDNYVISSRKNSNAQFRRDRVSAAWLSQQSRRLSGLVSVTLNRGCVKRSAWVPQMPSTRLQDTIMLLVQAARCTLTV